MGIGPGILVAATSMFLFAIAAPGADAGQAAHVQPPSEQAVRAFFGERRQPIYFDDTLARQFALGISGGVEEKRALADGTRFISTCRPHNCDDKAAAVVDPDGRIIGVGMIGFRCRKRRYGVPPCDDGPSAFVFVKRATMAKTRDVLRAWAKGRLVGATGKADPLKPNQGVFVVVLN